LPGNGGVVQQINDERTQSDIDDQSEDDSDLVVVEQRENDHIDPVLQELETPFPGNDDHWEEFDVRTNNTQDRARLLPEMAEVLTFLHDAWDVFELIDNIGA